MGTRFIILLIQNKAHISIASLTYLNASTIDNNTNKRGLKLREKTWVFTVRTKIYTTKFLVSGSVLIEKSKGGATGS